VPGRPEEPVQWLQTHERSSSAVTAEPGEGVRLPVETMAGAQPPPRAHCFSLLHSS